LKPARLWGFGGSSPGPTFEARCVESIVVEWVNTLGHQCSKLILLVPNVGTNLL